MSNEEQRREPDRDLALLLQAMMNSGAGPGAQYTLPEKAMREYARLVRADERQRCAAFVTEYVRDYDREYRELGGEIAAELEDLG